MATIGAASASSNNEELAAKVDAPLRRCEILMHGVGGRVATFFIHSMMVRDTIKVSVCIPAVHTTTD